MKRYKENDTGLCGKLLTDCAENDALQYNEECMQCVEKTINRGSIIRVSDVLFYMTMVFFIVTSGLQIGRSGAEGNYLVVFINIGSISLNFLVLYTIHTTIAIRLKAKHELIEIIKCIRNNKAYHDTK